MKVFIASAYGFDKTSFVIAAKDLDEAVEIARKADMGSVDADDVYESKELKTDLKNSCVIIEI